MMQFTTPVPIAKGKFPIDYNSKIISLGSCFAENMGNKLDYFKFKNSTNPFGILFHPLAIEKVIRKAITNEEFAEEDIFFHNERWNCFDVHSDLSNASKEDFLQNLNNLLVAFKKQLSEATHITITYGTSWIYREVSSHKVVANCHKLPQQHFEKGILSVENIKKAISQTIEAIHKINPKCTLIFTISPVRHIKDGFAENQWSKANLISALQSVLSVPSFGARGLYFPSYEIMMDELRDYRFYAEDLLHPNQTAIDYIWKHFSEIWISEGAVATMQEVEAIQKGLRHRPFNPSSEQHQKFLSSLKSKIIEIQERFPFIRF